MASQTEIIQPFFLCCAITPESSQLAIWASSFLAGLLPTEFSVLAIPLERFCLNGSTPEVSLQRLRLACQLFSSEPSGAG